MRNTPWARALRLAAAAALLLTSLGACSESNRIDAFAPEAIDAAAPPTGPTPMTVFSLLFDQALAAMPSACPSARQEGDTVVVEGGCTTEAGVEILGRMTHRGTPGYIGLGPVTYEGFGTVSPTRCRDRFGQTLTTVLDGSASSYTTEGRTRFSANLDIAVDGVGADCADVSSQAGLVYSGHADFDELDVQRQVWNGNGRFGERDLLDAGDAGGRTDLSTVNAVVDLRHCATEVLSGQTTVVGERRVEVFYDGETDCDVEATATWSLDGVMQDGELRGAL